MSKQQFEMNAKKAAEKARQYEQALEAIEGLGLTIVERDLKRNVVQFRRIEQTWLNTEEVIDLTTDDTGGL